MDIQAEIEAEHSKKMAIKVANYIGDNRKRFRILLELFLGNEPILVQRSGYPLSYCFDAHPEMVAEYAIELIDSLNRKEKRHVATKRNVLRTVSGIEIPESRVGMMAQYCFDILEHRDEPIAVRVYAMQILYNISNKEPDLKPELKMLIESFVELEGKGIRSRGYRLIKKLNREIKDQ